MENSSKMEKKILSSSGVKQEMDFKIPVDLPRRKNRKNNDAGSKRSGQKDIRTKSSSDDSVNQNVPSSTKIPSLKEDNVADVTSDFSAGWTPYKKVARKNVERKKQQMNERKVRQESKSKQFDTPGSQSKIKLIISQEDLSPVGVIHAEEAAETEEESQGLVHTEVDTVMCVTCKKTIPKHTYTKHVGDCLREKFKRKGTKCEPPSKQNKIDFVICQICQVDITEMSSTDQVHHVNDCLDGKNTKTKPDVSQLTEVRPTLTDTFQCQICLKDLTKWTTQRRTQHLNKCIDQLPSEDRESTSVEVHDRHNIDRNTTKPKHNKKTRKRATNTRQRQESARGPKRLDEPANKLDEATQLALALSESLRKDHEDSDVDPLNPQIHTESSEDVRKTNAFSILMSPKPSEKVPKKRRGKKGKVLMVPDLVTTTDQQRSHRLEEKLASLLPSQESAVFPTPHFPISRFTTSETMENTDHTEDGLNTQQPSLWEIDSRRCSETTQTEQHFYVEKLFPQVVPSVVQAGSKIKKMMKIPGWKPIEATGPHTDVAHDLQNETVHNTTVGQTMLASTQTAVLLAELAGDPDLTSRSGDLTTHMSHDQTCLLNETRRHNRTVQFNVCQPSPRSHGYGLDRHSLMQSSISGSEPGPLKQERATCQLENDLERLLVTGVDSDFTVLCRGDRLVPAHTLFLKARCPGLIEASSSGRISLPSYSENCIKTLLKFIYTGKLDIHPDDALQVKFLAEMFNLPLLSEACKEVGLQTASAAETTVSQELIDKTLQNFLQDVWSSDSDSDTSSVAGDKHRNGEDDEEDRDLELDELYEFVASQKKTNFMSSSCSECSVDGRQADSDDTCDNKHLETLNKTTVGAALRMKLEESFMLDVVGSFVNKPVKSTDEVDSSSSMVADDDSSICSEILELNNKSVSPSGEKIIESALSGSEQSGDNNLDTILGESLCGYSVDEECSNLEREERFEASPEMSISGSAQECAAFPGTPTATRTYSQHSTTPDLFGCSDQSSAEGDCEETGLTPRQTPSPQSGQVDQLNSCITSPNDDLFESFQEAYGNSTNSKDLSLDTTSHGCQALATSLCEGEDQENRDNSIYEQTVQSPLRHMGPSPHPAEDSSDDSTEMVKSFNSNSNCTSPVLQSSKNKDKCISSHLEQNVYRKRLRHSTTSSEEASKLGPSPKRSRRRDRNTSLPQKRSTQHKSQEVHNMPEQVIDLTLDQAACDDVSGLLSDPGPCVDDGMVPAHTEVSSPTCDDQQADTEVIQLDQSPDSLTTSSPHSPATYTERSPDKSDMEEDEGTSLLAADGNTVSPGCEEHNTSTYGEPEVWDQFDDAGAALDSDFLDQSNTDVGVLHFSLTPKRPALRSPDPNLDYSEPEEEETPHSPKSPGRRSARADFKTPTSTVRSRQADSVVEFDPPTDMETDVSMAIHDAEDSILWKDDNAPDVEEKEVTPVVKAKVKKKNKKWVPPSPFTPMADYNEMVTPHLKKACQKYGVRALPKKKMVVVLTDIYKRTHQYETDSEFDGTPQPKVSRPAASQSTSGDPGPPSQSTSREPGASRSSKPTKGRGKSVASKHKASSSKGLGAKKAKGVGKTKSVHQTHDSDSSVDNNMAESDTQDLDSSGCSMQDCDLSASQIPEESIMITEDSTKEKKVSKRDLAYKKQQIWDFIKEKPHLYEEMLHYEPLDFSSFHQQLKESGLNMGVGVVMDFLDEQNVQFTMKNQTTSRQRNKKKSRKKKAPTMSQQH